MDPGASEFPGNDAEGPDRAGRLQVQGRKEAVRGPAGPPGLQGLPQTAPRLVGRAVDLDRIVEDLLSQVDPSGFDQQSALMWGGGGPRGDFSV